MHMALEDSWNLEAAMRDTQLLVLTVHRTRRPVGSSWELLQSRWKCLQGDLARLGRSWSPPRFGRSGAGPMFFQAGAMALE